MTRQTRNMLSAHAKDTIAPSSDQIRIDEKEDEAHLERITQLTNAAVIGAYEAKLPISKNQTSLAG